MPKTTHQGTGKNVALLVSSYKCLLGDVFYKACTMLLQYYVYKSKTYMMYHISSICRYIFKIFLMPKMPDLKIENTDFEKQTLF